MTTDEAFKFCANFGGCSKDIERLKSTRPTKQQLQYTLESMINNGQRLDDSREALWLVDEFFNEKEATNKKLKENKV